MVLTYIESGLPVKVGDKVPGKRLSHYYAIVEAIHWNYDVDLRYNGEVRTVRVRPDVIDAELR